MYPDCRPERQLGPSPLSEPKQSVPETRSRPSPSASTIVSSLSVSVVRNRRVPRATRVYRTLPGSRGSSKLQQAPPDGLPPASVPTAVTTSGAPRPRLAHGEPARRPAARCARPESLGWLGSGSRPGLPKVLPTRTRPARSLVARSSQSLRCSRSGPRPRRVRHRRLLRQTPARCRTIGIGPQPRREPRAASAAPSGSSGATCTPGLRVLRLREHVRSRGRGTAQPSREAPRCHPTLVRPRRSAPALDNVRAVHRRRRCSRPSPWSTSR